MGWRQLDEACGARPLIPRHCRNKRCCWGSDPLACGCRALLQQATLPGGPGCAYSCPSFPQHAMLMGCALRCVCCCLPLPQQARLVGCAPRAGWPSPVAATSDARVGALWGWRCGHGETPLAERAVKKNAYHAGWVGAARMTARPRRCMGAASFNRAANRPRAATYHAGWASAACMALCPGVAGHL